MRHLIKQIEYIFSFKLLSPLLTTIQDSALINVGSIDKTTAIEPLRSEEMPYIAESSIKGKMRYIAHQLGYDTKTIEKYFGSEETKEGATIINICSLRAVDNPYIDAQNRFFTKSEVSVNRIDGKANPRFFRVASPGAEFECRLNINIYENDITESEAIKFIDSILTMLEDSYIGAGGSRGLGKIKITSKKIQIKPLNSVEVIQNVDTFKDEIVYLKFRKHSLNVIQSSTIAALFAYTLSNQSALIDGIYNGESIRVSSAMPCININNNRLHFFPMPNYFVKGIKTSQNKKDFWGIKYISESLLKDFFKEPSVIQKWCEQINSYKIIENQLLLTNNESQNLINHNKLFELIDTMHVSIDPDTGSYKEGVLFSTNEYFFSEIFEFFFLIRHNLNDLNLLFKKVQSFGVGRDKSTGLGHFIYEIKPNHFDFMKDEPSSPSRYISLSLIHPSDEDREQLKRGGSTYTVITRKGKRENNSYTGTGDFRAEKDKVFMLKEGSVFDFKIKGSAPVVYPTNEEGYEIKDFGYSFLIGF